MKKALLMLVVVFCLSFNDSTAQKAVQTTTEESNFKFYVGPMLGVNGMISTNSPNERKEQVAFGGFDVGVATLVPFEKTEKLGLLLELFYTSQTLKFEDNIQGPSGSNFQQEYGYFNISPSIYLSGFTMGLNIGIPMGDMTNLVGANSVPPANTLELKTRFDVRLGGYFDVVESETGKAFVSVFGSYNLNGLYDYNSDIQNSGANLSFIPQPASIHIGFSYLFKVQP